jgi:predicted nucleic acid-binding protein
MMLIDTNVISEIMKVSPSLQVLEWLNNQDSNPLPAPTEISWAEGKSLAVP